jgi:hypothetical protein
MTRISRRLRGKSSRSIDHGRLGVEVFPKSRAVSEAALMTIYLDIPHLKRFGWIRIEGAVPVSLCERLVEVLEAQMSVPVHDQLRWHEYDGEPHDLVPI